MSLYKDIKTGLKQAIAYENGENKVMNINDFVITEVVDIYCYYLKCPRCGYENSKENLAKICPTCGENLCSCILENIER